MARDGRSPHRDAVLATLQEAQRALTAQELHQAIADREQRIGLATVYRALDVLTREGQVATLPASSREQRYVTCSREHHHHVVCTECGHVAEVHLCPVDAVQGAAEQESGFELTSHVLDFFGRCPACRSA